MQIVPPSHGLQFNHHRGVCTCPALHASCLHASLARRWQTAAAATPVHASRQYAGDAGYMYMLECCCTPCRYADARWAADVDYMFFRNSYGSAAQLATKLQPCRGSAAMCCQCSWASCSRATKLADAAQQAGHSLRWICRGHE
jgi:hypothetical protein